MGEDRGRDGVPVLDLSRDLSEVDGDGSVLDGVFEDEAGDVERQLRHGERGCVCVLFIFRPTMPLATHKAPSGTFLVHSAHCARSLLSRLSPALHPLCPALLHVRRRPHPTPPPPLTFSSQQPNPVSQAVVTDHWIKLILSYARYRRLWTLRLEDVETPGSDWDEIVRNTRIKRTSDLFFPLINLIVVSRPTFTCPSVCDPGHHGATRLRRI